MENKKISWHPSFFAYLHKSNELELEDAILIVNFEHISHFFLVFLMLTFPKDSYQRSRLAPTRRRQDLNLRILFSFWRVDAYSSIMCSVV